MTAREGRRGALTGAARAAALAALLAVPFLPARADSSAPTEAPPLFPKGSQESAELERNLQTARWMFVYDRVAWLTSDLLPKESKEVQAKVGPIWFCLEKNHVWYAFYGRLTATGYEVAVCYREKAKDAFEAVAPPVFPETEPFAMAINLTQPELDILTRSTTVRFNYYIRTVADQIEAYFLPAFQSDGKLAYGVQQTYILTATGGRVLSREIHGRTLYGYSPDKGHVISLEMTECVVPTPQALFTMMSYREAFGDIVTHCRDAYIGLAKRDGQLVCVRAAAPGPSSQTWSPGPVSAAPPPGH
jgi:hypothetical protein